MTRRSRSRLSVLAAAFALAATIVLIPGSNQARADVSLATGFAGSGGLTYTMGYVQVSTAASPTGVQSNAQLADYITGSNGYAAHPILANPGVVPSQTAVNITNPYPGWAANNSSSVWIGADANGASGTFAPFIGTYNPAISAPQGYFYYTTTFNVGSPPPYSLSGTVWTSDNQGLRIFLNGHDEGQSNPGSFGTVATPFTLNQADFISGNNTITFVVFNEQFGSSHDSPTGIRIQGTLSAVPEPSVVGLIASSLPVLGLALLRRRRASV